MIPTLILVGLVAGGIVGHRRLVGLCIAGVVASVLWGVGVGIAAASLTTFFGGALLAVVNFAVGAVVGLGIHEMFRMILVRKAPSLNR